jgi:hypothetical protein
MLEHVRDWHEAVVNLKGLLRPGGHLLITTRSAGFPYHAWPYDFWRYELDDFRRIFADMDILTLESDSASPGVFMFARRPDPYRGHTPELALLSIVTGRHQLQVTDGQINWFRATSRPRFAAAQVRNRLAQAWRAMRRVRLRRNVRQRIIGPTWMLIPETTRRRLKRAIGRPG